MATSEKELVERGALAHPDLHRLDDVNRDVLKILPRVGFVAQDRPLYGDLTVAETLELGRRLNERWDAPYALARVQRFGLQLSRRVRTLSTGQRAHVATSVALGKRPELLLLDEPVANLDPIARLALLEELMSVVAEDGWVIPTGRRTQPGPTGGRPAELYRAGKAWRNGG